MAEALKKQVENLEKTTAKNFAALIVSTYPDMQDEIEALCKVFLKKASLPVQKEKRPVTGYHLLMREKKAEFMKNGMSSMEAFRLASKEASAEWKIMKANMDKKKEEDEDEDEEEEQDEDENEE